MTTRTLTLTLSMAATLLASALIAPVASADERAERATATRQGALKLMGFYMAPLGGMARGRIPVDAATVARNAQHIAALAPMLSDTFKYDTRGSGVESESLDVIWEKPKAFQGKVETLIEKAADLTRIAGDGDEGKIKGGIAALGGACGSCHDDFRVDD